MNVKQTHEYFEANGIVAIRADKGVTKTAGQIDNLLEELGNATRAIPYYAIYPPGGGEPMVLEGLILSKNVIDIFEKFDSPSAPEGGTKISTSTKKSEGGNKKVAVKN